MSDGSELRAGVESARLASGMRELRGRTGLSLAALAERTPYSKSSWERYLNGKNLPPRDAVGALCRLAGEPAGRLTALWELADAAWSGRAAPSAGPGPAPEAPAGRGSGEQESTGRRSAGPRSTGPEPAVAEQAAAEQVVAERVAAEPAGAGRAVRLPRAWVPVAAAACAGGLAVVVALAFWADRERGDGPAGRAAPAPSVVTGCRGAACDGKDPQSMFCGGEGLVDTVLERTAARGRHLQVRYGTACGAAWGRLSNGRVGDRIEVSVPGARPRSVRVRDRFDVEGYLVTPMAAARGPRGIRLCLFPAGGAERECFSR
ncbi:helix-turn-helix domain-containing protein [Streptomyces sp. NPDC056411]|uniref:helix-turn-helix domain-containing protein n=1 Tax=Streptomyces sp. NPDC056411 TaxID=3345813 RepID=UPI0035DE59D0